MEITIKPHAGTRAATEAIEKMDYWELKHVQNAIKRRWGDLTAKLARELEVGDPVWFEDRNNKRVTGVVEKVNRKTVIVNVGFGGASWRVSPQLLNYDTGHLD